MTEIEDVVFKIIIIGMTALSGYAFITWVQFKRHGTRADIE